MLNSVVLALLLLLAGSAAGVRRAIPDEQATDSGYFEGFAINTGVTATNFLDSARPIRASGLRAGAVASESIVVEDSLTHGDRDLQTSANVQINNNCGFNSYIGVMYTTGSTAIWKSWPIIANGGSVSLSEVTDSKIYIYGLKTDWTYVWQSTSSPHCFSTGDCLSERDVGSLSDGSVQYNICGGSTATTTPAPTPAPTLAPSPAPTATTDGQWLQGHNNRRTQFYTENNKGSMDLKWADSLQQSAQNYANQLLQIGGSTQCRIAHGHNGDTYGGENLASNRGSVARTPEEVMTTWYDTEIGLPYGQKGHATQMVFRSSHYVGCAGAEKDLDNGEKCFIQVCRYLAPGNCNMSPGGWLERTLDDKVICGPACPEEGCF